MSVKIRLQRKGRKKRPFYHIVIADARAPRDGRFIEKIGTYNPMTKPATIDLDREKAYDWLLKGAQPTETVRAILRFKGVLYKKHLMLGVRKGALTEEQAQEKYDNWIGAKDAKIAARRQKAQAEYESFLQQVSGQAPKPATPEPVEEETPVAPVAEAPVEEEAPVAETAEETTAEPVAEQEETKE